MTRSQLGRGPQATTDMKLRIDALKTDGADVVEALWERFAASLFDGQELTYEYAQQPERQPELV